MDRRKSQNLNSSEGDKYGGERYHNLMVVSKNAPGYMMWFNCVCCCADTERM